MSTPTKRAPASGPVELLYEDYRGLAADLGARSPSGLTALNRSYHKVILIAAASSLEAQVKSTVRNVFDREGRVELSTFVEKRVMARNYSQLFDWRAHKATSFFSSFGDNCANTFKALLRDEELFRREHDAFMELGSLRNELVHQDYASYPLQNTPEEIIEMYRLAVRFPDRFESIIFP